MPAARRAGGRSRAVAVARSWPEHVRRRLGIDPVLLAMFDALVTGCALALDDDDPRPWHKRIESDIDGLIAELFDGLDPGAATDRLQTLVDVEQGEIVSWIRKLNGRGGGARYLMRALGSGRYYRIRKALKEDAAVLIVAVRRVIRWFLPFSVAVDDCSSLLSVDQLTAIYAACAEPGSKPQEVTNSMVRFFLMMDEQIDKVVAFGIPVPQTTTRIEERHHLDAGDLDALEDRLRAVVSAQSQDLIIDLSQTLANKIQGARDALQHSADPVSQAANSMIELIDRVLRGAFDDGYVLDWLVTNMPDQTGLSRIHPSNGKIGPTKRGQALCFAYAGQKVDKRSVFSEIAALGLCSARDRLQQLKHADQGTADEQQQLVGLISAVEAYLVLSLRLGWSLNAQQADLERLQAKFVRAA